MSFDYFVVLLNCFYCVSLHFFQSRKNVTPFLNLDIFSLDEILYTETILTCDSAGYRIVILNGRKKCFIVNESCEHVVSAIRLSVQESDRNAFNGRDSREIAAAQRPGSPLCVVVIVSSMAGTLRASVHRQLGVSHYCRCYFRNTLRRHRDKSDMFG